MTFFPQGKTHPRGIKPELPGATNKEGSQWDTENTAAAGASSGKSMSTMRPSAEKSGSPPFGRDAKKTTNFRVSLEYPTMAAAARDLERLKKDGLTVQGNKIVFEVPVQPLNEDQIRVEW